MVKKQTNMRTFLVLMILLVLLGCSKNLNYLQGTWLGNYNGNDIRLFIKDDSLTISYLETGNVLIKKFVIDGDRLLMYPQIIDSCKIVKLNKNNLVLRPINKLQPDVNVIFLIEFIKKR